MPHKPVKKGSYYENIRRVEGTVGGEREAGNQRLRRQAMEKSGTYHQILFEKGLITEQERNRRTNRIKPAAARPVEWPFPSRRKQKGRRG